MSELWISHHSIRTWQEPQLWRDYFAKAQAILGVSLTHLDTSDPVRRRVISLADAGDFVCAFKRSEESRWLFGKCADSGIALTVQHFRQIQHFPNTLRWHVPTSFVDKPDNLQRIISLFFLGNRSLDPFYSYSDDVEQIASKKKSSGAVDIQAELLGVFWLTYFNPAYVAFFGRSAFDSLPVAEQGNDGGVTVTLGERPSSVSTDLRLRAAEVLGRESFVDPTDVVLKLRGRFALTFEQLKRNS